MAEFFDVPGGRIAYDVAGRDLQALRAAIAGRKKLCMSARMRLGGARCELA